MKMRRTKSNSTDFEVITLSEVKRRAVGHRDYDDDPDFVLATEVKSCPVGHGDPLHDLEWTAAVLRGMKRSLSRSRYRKMVEGTGYILHARTVDIWWGGYEYPVPLDEIDSPLKLIAVLAHIGQKTWPGMNPSRISSLIQVLNKRFGWDMWRGEG